MTLAERLAPATAAAPAPAPVGPLLLTGAAIAATGGPLALAAVNVPGVVAAIQPSAGLAVVAGTAVFLPVLAIWWRYSGVLASSGGLYTFTRAAAGRWVAAGQGAAWVVSYLLYAAYTVDYVASDVLPAASPTVADHRNVAIVVLTAAVAAVVVLPLRGSLAVVGVVAVGQVAVGGLLVASAAGLGGWPASSLTAGAPTGALAQSTADIGLLFVCASLPLFLGGEVRGGGTTLRRATAVGVAVTAVVLVAATVPLAAVAAPGAAVPGATLAGRFLGPAGAATVAAGAGASILALVVLEAIALSRLLHAWSGLSVRATGRGMAAVFSVASLATLVLPAHAYDALTAPSLVALWVAMLPVCAAWPWLAARTRGLRASDVLLAAAACALVGYGLYQSLTSSLGT